MPQDIVQKNWLGQGIAFPVRFDLKSLDLESAAYEESVRQSILIILGTAKGERVMRPDFGCGVYDFVFEPSTPTTAGKISQVVQDDLLFFEPRIDVRDVQVESMFDSDGSKLMIQVNYEVRATNNIFNLVYPFYLERSPG
jgi:uncharacterized protein